MEGVQEATLDTQPLPQLRSRLEIRTIGVPAGKPACGISGECLSSAARSLEEALEETLTVHRLGIGAVLRRKLATSNPIESCLSTVQWVARNVKRWREGNQPLRWTATGLLEAEKKFRRIKGYQAIKKCCC